MPGYQVKQERIAVAGGHVGPDGKLAGGTVVTPCGGCRQKLREFCGDPKSFTVLAINEGGQQQQWTLEELLPGSFGPDHLNLTPST